jgi:MoaA/NifB/PqqE/SkfB family radical SAM enzyme
MLKLRDIKALNIEASSKCSAKCPFCSRNQRVRPYGGHQITLSDFKRLPVALFNNLRRVTFSGNFGDFASNPETIDITKYTQDLNEDIIVEGETNGSVQSETWWGALGALVQKGCVVFCVDGLEDTHGLHRIGTDFHRITRNIRAFTRAGGVAHWKFIVFKHNEHQIEKAEALASDLGCTRFYAVSSRDYDETLQKPKSLDFEIKRDIFFSYWEELRGAGEHALCKPLGNRSLYIAADGTVHPCCLAHCMYITEHNDLFGYIVPLIEKYQSEINFKTRPLEEIITGPYFEEVLETSKTNPYCMIKCSKYKKEIRKQLVLHDTYFGKAG